MKISFLGQGAMGVRMADRIAAAGNDVTRWNRSGADRSPHEAVAGADVVIAMVRDDAASSAVWDGPEGALVAMRPGSVAIESSTLTPKRIAAFGRAAQAAGVRALDAPVLGSRPQAEAGQLIHLIGGDAAVIDDVMPVLGAMSAAQLRVGPFGQGTALKLVANTLFGIQVTAIAELLARSLRLGLDPASTIDLLGQTPLLGLAAKSAAMLMLAGSDDPMFPVDLVAKDFGYAVDDASAMPLATAAAQVFDRASKAGLGGRNLTAVARLY